MTEIWASPPAPLRGRGEECCLTPCPSPEERGGARNSSSANDYYCLLLTAYCLLLTAYCLLPTASCLLPTAYCLLPTTPSLLFNKIFTNLPAWQFQSRIFFNTGN